MLKKIIGVLILAIILIFGGMYISKMNTNDQLKEKVVEETKEINKEDSTTPETVAEDNKKENNMTEENKNEVITTASGLQYEVIRMGDGVKPVATDTVEVHYEGRLENGEIFDSSYKRGEKISFPLNGVIAGWTEGLQLMPVGSKFKFTIPAELAYGPEGSGHPLSGKTLIFDVELFDIK